MPVYGTIASQFNDPGANSLYKAIMDKFSEKGLGNFNSSFEITDEMSREDICNSTQQSALLIRNIRKQQSIR